MNTYPEAPFALIPEEMRCKYPSKRCESARVLKRDGDFHRFCEFHRLKANMNQQRLEQRRRMASPRTAARNAAAATAKRSKRHTTAPTTTASSPTSVFDPELPSLDVEDLDLDLLGDLLDMPPCDALDVDDTQVALQLLATDAVDVSF